LNDEATNKCADAGCASEGEAPNDLDVAVEADTVEALHPHNPRVSGGARLARRGSAWADLTLIRHCSRSSPVRRFGRFHNLIRERGDRSAPAVVVDHIAKD
jgi:hypothetical protein